MMSTSLRINGRNWEVSALDERTLLIGPADKVDILSGIHETTKLLEQCDISEILDIIPAYQSIALVFDHVVIDVKDEIRSLQKQLSTEFSQISPPKKHEVLVCYELGLDWKEVESHTGLNREEIIKKHSETEYSIATMGFTPGFVYLEGMLASISTPRRQNPRTKIPAGSVGIGGSQTGFYGLESPGGWQIIGRTPNTYFRVGDYPPTPFSVGDKLRFTPISKQEFESLEQENRLS
ncbi:allophanate hydrolase subunit 1 [Gracilimonas sp.]|uniref:5-oxoprolinase subunit B family protein n=1 Tax=Gracilimonas sp. TaxID=1974203 RepID=UPI002871C6A6|nr:allophanate hydrolase subunit 1 [Gracilimonas sp.]